MRDYEMELGQPREEFFLVQKKLKPVSFRKFGAKLSLDFMVEKSPRL